MRQKIHKSQLVTYPVQPFQMIRVDDPRFNKLPMNKYDFTNTRLHHHFRYIQLLQHFMQEYFVGELTA